MNEGATASVRSHSSFASLAPPFVPDPVAPLQRHGFWWRSRERLRCRLLDCIRLLHCPMQLELRLPRRVPLFGCHLPRCWSYLMLPHSPPPTQPSEQEEARLTDQNPLLHARIAASVVVAPWEIPDSDLVVSLRMETAQVEGPTPPLARVGEASAPEKRTTVEREEDLNSRKRGRSRDRSRSGGVRVSRRSRASPAPRMSRRWGR
jgi:hypothetical protein